MSAINHSRENSIQSPKQIGWHLLWLLCIAAGVGLTFIYATIPTDGALGDLDSFNLVGFKVHRVFGDIPSNLRPGDVIVKAGDSSLDEKLGRFSQVEGGDGEGSYLVIRDAEQIQVIIEKEPLALSKIFEFGKLQLLSSFLLIFIGVITFFNFPRTLAARLIMVGSVFLALQIWIDVFSYSFSTLDYPYLFWTHVVLDTLTLQLGVAAFSHFLFIYPIKSVWTQKAPAIFPSVFYIAPPLFALTAFIFAQNPAQGLNQINGLNNIVVSVFGILGFFAAAKNFIDTEETVPRMQLRWIFVSVGGIIALILFPGYAFPLALNQKPILNHGTTSLALPLIAGAFSIGIFRFQIINLDRLVRRMMAILFVGGFMAAVYFSVYFVLEITSRLIIGRVSGGVIVLSTLTMVISARTFFRRIDKIVENWFYRERVDFRQKFQEFNRNLRTILDLPKLLDEVVTHTGEIFEADYAAIFLRSAQGQFNLSKRYSPIENGSVPQFSLIPNELPAPLTETSRNFEQSIYMTRLGEGRIIHRPEAKSFPILVPLAVPKNGQLSLVGVLALGHRNGQQPYNSESRFLLSELANQAGTAIYIAQIVKEKERDADFRKDAEKRLEIYQKSPLGRAEALAHLIVDNPGSAMSYLHALTRDASTQPELASLLSHLPQALYSLEAKDIANLATGFNYLLTSILAPELVKVGLRTILQNIDAEPNIRSDDSNRVKIIFEFCLLAINVDSIREIIRVRDPLIKIMDMRLHDDVPELRNL